MHEVAGSVAGRYQCVFLHFICRYFVSFLSWILLTSVKNNIVRKLGLYNYDYDHLSTLSKRDDQCLYLICMRRGLCLGVGQYLAGIITFYYFHLFIIFTYKLHF